MVSPFNKQNVFTVHFPARCSHECHGPRMRLADLLGSRRSAIPLQCSMFNVPPPLPRAPNFGGISPSFTFPEFP